MPPSEFPPSATRLDEFSLPIGAALPEWSARAWPSAVILEGNYCSLEPLDAARRADELYEAYRTAPDARDWTYMAVGPFDDVEAYRRYAELAERSSDPRHWAVIDRTTAKAVGTLALLRQDPANGVVEVGSVTFSPRMKRTPMSTDAQFLLMRYVFEELGYRRYEWKCDALNAPSRRAAERLGFTFEGIFRQAVVYKGRNRDTAWYSIIDREWPQRKRALLEWLSHGNFDERGRQRTSLSGSWEMGR